MVVNKGSTDVSAMLPSSQGTKLYRLKSIINGIVREHFLSQWPLLGESKSLGFINVNRGKKNHPKSKR